MSINVFKILCVFIFWIFFRFFSLLFRAHALLNVKNKVKILLTNSVRWLWWYENKNKSKIRYFCTSFSCFRSSFAHKLYYRRWWFSEKKIGCNFLFLFFSWRKKQKSLLSLTRWYERVFYEFLCVLYYVYTYDVPLHFWDRNSWWLK